MVKSSANPGPAGPSTQPPLKRQKIEDTDQGRQTGPGTKKTRNRVSYSCGECHRRKQKCDRQIPCGHCLARKVPELCKAYTPGKSDQDLHARVSRLENIIEAAFPHLANPPSTSASVPQTPIEGLMGLDDSESVAESNHSGPDDADTSPGTGTFQGGRWFGDSAVSSVAPASVLEQLQNAVEAVAAPSTQSKKRSDSDVVIPSESRQNKLGNVRDRPTPLSALLQDRGTPYGGDQKPMGFNIDAVRQTSERSAAENLRLLVEDCGVSPSKITELMKELPEQKYMDVLVDFYFQTINWTRYPISQREFRTSYMTLCANTSGFNPNDFRFLPLLFVVLAIAVRLAPEHIAGDTRIRRIASQRYYWSSRRALLIAAALQADSLDMVLIRLLSARFLTFDRRITECWSQLGAAVRTAQALGLHRDSAGMGMDPAQVEYRRRIWSYLYHADRSYALVLGRPHSIQDDYTSALPPLNIEDDFPLAQLRKPPPISQPTSMTFVILRHALASIIGKMTHHFQQVRRASHYSDVLSLDEELLNFINTLPPQFSLEPDTSQDDIKTYIPVHRYLLVTEVMFVRINLHRPYFLRKLRSDRYQRSRTACFESAKRDFQVRQAFRASMSREARHSHSNAYREFQTAMVAGIYLVLHPEGKDAEAMHAILDVFLAEHDGVPDMDETTQRELKIIEFLRTKSRRTSDEDNGGDRRHGQGDCSQTTDAHLLLSLGRPDPVTRPPFSDIVSPELAQNPVASASMTASLASSPRTENRSDALFQSPLQSPTMRRLQTQHSPEAFPSSPQAIGSPADDDPMSAQFLLDQWVNTVNGSLGEGMPATGNAWPIGGSFGMEFQPWIPSTAQAPPLGDMSVPFEGSDWNYWETLVNQIRTGP